MNKTEFFMKKMLLHIFYLKIFTLSKCHSPYHRFKYNSEILKGRVRRCKRYIWSTKGQSSNTRTMLKVKPSNVSKLCGVSWKERNIDFFLAVYYHSLLSIKSTCFPHSALVFLKTDISSHWYGWPKQICKSLSFFQ